MKIQKYSYLPTGHSHSINFGLGLTFDAQQQRHIVSMFAINDNGGAPLCKYLPEVCLDVLEQCGGTPKLQASDYVWTYSAGNISTSLDFSITSDGFLCHMNANNPVAFARELEAGSMSEGDFLWSIAEYESFYNKSSPLQISRRRDFSEPMARASSSFFLVPCLSPEFNRHHLFSRLIHADLFDRHKSTKFFLADAAKLRDQFRPSEDSVALPSAVEKKAYVGKMLEQNTPQAIMDFGLWSYSDRFNTLTFASGNSFFDTCEVGIKALITDMKLPFIPLGITHTEECPHVEDKVHELAYGDKPVYLNSRGPIIE